jgi:hypothetical protein
VIRWLAKFSNSLHARAAARFCLALAASALWVLVASGAIAGESGAPATGEPTGVGVPAKDDSAEAVARREAWRATMSRIPAPRKGCFTADYPNTRWRETPCSPPPAYPNPPARKAQPDSVGNVTDFSAQVTGLISSVVGSFDSVAPATITETGTWSGNPQSPNAFTLQLNTQTFSAPACNGVAGCQGWQQFIYSQNQCNGACVFMEYWLLGFGSPCPKGPWIQNGNNCFFNSASRSAPAITTAQLKGTTLTATSAGGVDTVVLTTQGGSASATAADSVLNLAQVWNTVEWNVFGDCCNTQAVFTNGSTIVARTVVNSGGQAAPTCLTQSFTGETNNLNLVTPCFSEGPVEAVRPPAMVFTESLTTPVPGCAYPNGVTACVAEPGSTISDEVFTAACPGSGGLTMQRMNLGQWEALPQHCSDGSFPGSCGPSAIVANAFVLGTQQYGFAYSGAPLGVQQTVQLCDTASRCSQFFLTANTCASLPSVNDKFYLNPGSSPLQLEAGDAANANLIMDGPWVAADHGNNASGVAFDAAGLPPGVIVSLSPGESGAPHSYGLMNLYVVTSFTTPPGAYSFQVKATDSSSNVTQRTSIPLQIAACTPRATCPAANLCGPVSDGCGGSVDCGSCASGSCSNSFCCPSGSFYNTALNTCQPNSCPSGTEYCYDLGACVTAKQCAKASQPICHKVRGVLQCQ